MNQEAYDEHALWSTVDSLKEMLATDLAGDFEQNPDEFRLINSAVEYFDSLRELGAGLVDEDTLDGINDDLTQGRDYLANYVGDRETNAALLTTSAIPSVVNARQSAIRGLPAPTADGSVRAAQGALKTYRSAADSAVSDLRARVDELQNRFVEINDQTREDSESARRDLATLQEKITEGEQQVATQTSQLQEQIETQRTAFNSEVEQRVKAFKDSEASRESAGHEQRNRQGEDADAALKKLQEYREQARGLVDATSRDVISGDYRGWATKQATAALRWTITTVVIGLATVAALVGVVLTAADDSVHFLLAKSTIGLIGLILAGYTARQAAEHRQEERTANRLALDLAALEPFLEHVEEPDKLRTAVASRVFIPTAPARADRQIRLRGRGMTMTELFELLRAYRPPPS